MCIGSTSWWSGVTHMNPSVGLMQDKGKQNSVVLHSMTAVSLSLEEPDLCSTNSACQVLILTSLFQTPNKKL